ncbi:MAG: hypothetical protein OCD03_11225 [Hyphomicrobiales bacterium]
MNKTKSRFIDLTPVDNADPDGSYSDALTYAVNNSRIKNIAITGPYGSGKSSIIKTFEKSSSLKILNISLASFQKEGNSDLEMLQIERSILQQMLYGADANKLPYSRFKRIVSPSHPFLVPFVFVVWAITIFYLFGHKSELIDLTFFSPFSFGKLITLGIGALVSIFLASHIYKSSFGVSLKKISLTNAEVETGDQPEKSILNHHLDEIIYFFQETDYRMVVFEDLDRFGNPEIFVKLREINKLINDNSETAGNVKFLYALKDDMFIQKSRVKFFDFIIPVVPIVNASNSLDKMLERLNVLDFSVNIERQFLRDVSLYLDDLRLIHNIINELIIYHDQLQSEHLDITKLLAMIIYKNIYPKDFEELHYGRGLLFEICAAKLIYIEQEKEEMRKKIRGLNKSISAAINEEARTVSELISIYIGKMINRQSGRSVIGIYCNNKVVNLKEIFLYDNFIKLRDEAVLKLAVANTPYQNVVEMSIGCTFKDIEEEINPGETFLSRKLNIENNTETKRNDAKEKIFQIESEISKLHLKKLFELISSNKINFSKLKEKHEFKDEKLIFYLVKDGYLDENYYQYISTFHEGRLTKMDRDYLLTIRNSEKPNPNQIIDTPKEVCINMHPEDFGQMYVLNVTLVDYLLETKGGNASKLKTAMEYISNNFDKSEEFLSSYYSQGHKVSEFVFELSEYWPNFALVSMASINRFQHIANIICFADEKNILTKMNKSNNLTHFLSKNGHLILNSGVQKIKEYGIFKKLNVSFIDLGAIEEGGDLLAYVKFEWLYNITAENIFLILHDDEGFSQKKAETRNYSLINSPENEHLSKFLEKHIIFYVRNVFLTLPNNTEEDETAIKKLINNSEINASLSKEIITKQQNVFKTFDEVPSYLWSHLFDEEKIIICWQNISTYLESEKDIESAREYLTGFLSRTKILETLVQEKISDELEEKIKLNLVRFIVNNDDFEDSNYCRYLKCFSNKFSNFPKNISDKKLECYARERIVGLTDETYEFSKEKTVLITILIANNFEEYILNKGKYEVGDDVRELLMLSEIDNKSKLLICRDIDPTYVRTGSVLSRAISQLLISTDVNLSTIDDAVVKSAIQDCSTIEGAIKLLIKCLDHWNKEFGMKVIAKLPPPYSDISKYGKKPKIENNKLNSDFVAKLKNKKYISSYSSVIGSKIRIYTYKSADHRS